MFDASKPIPEGVDPKELLASDPPDLAALEASSEAAFAAWRARQPEDKFNTVVADKAQQLDDALLKQKALRLARQEVARAHEAQEMATEKPVRLPQPEEPPGERRAA